MELCPIQKGVEIFLVGGTCISASLMGPLVLMQTLPYFTIKLSTVELTEFVIVCQREVPLKCFCI